MPDVTTNQIAELTGCDRATVRKYLADVPFRTEGSGVTAAKVYTSSDVLTIRQMAQRTHLSPKDALDEARREEIELRMEIRRGERPRLSEVVETFEELCAEISGIVKGSALEDERKGDIMQGIIDALKRVSAKPSSEDE